jgi:DsbC/DsbD-like thiol-disulfide interchange protein
MKARSAWLRMVAACCWIMSTLALASSNEFVDERATVSLISEQSSFQLGTRAWVGIEIAHQSGWHTYWSNPGDSGLPTRLEWELPNNFRAGEIAWPAPKRFDVGGIYNFGYDNVVLLPILVDVPQRAEAQTSVSLIVHAKWLICSHEVCVPRKAKLQLDMPISKNRPVPNPKTAPLFAAARAAIPRDESWRGEARVDQDRVRIELRTANLLRGELDVFPITEKILSNAPPQIEVTRDRIAIVANKSDYFDATAPSLQLVLTERGVDGESVNAWKLEVPVAVGTSASSKIHR